MPPVGTTGRAKCYQWISYLLTEFGRTFMDRRKAPFWHFRRKRRIPDVVNTATWEFSTAVRLLEQAIEDRAFPCRRSLHGRGCSSGQHPPMGKERAHDGG